MPETNKPKRRNNVNKRLDSAAIKKREREAEKRKIPKLKDLSLAINQRLLDLGKNQEWLVDETGIGKATISAYYNAESMPNGVNLIKLAEVLETTPDYLLGYTKSPTTDMDIKSICEKTGLSIESIAILQKLNEFKMYSGTKTSIIANECIDQLIKNRFFYTILRVMLDTAITKCTYEKVKANPELDLPVWGKSKREDVNFHAWKLEHYAKQWVMDSLKVYYKENALILEKILSEEEDEFYKDMIEMTEEMKSFEFPDIVWNEQE